MSRLVDDYVSRAVGLLVSQFFDASQLQGIIEAFALEYDDLDITSYDMIFKRTLDTAFGLQLDGIGDLVGEKRNGREDEPYREAIRFRVFINTSFPTPPVARRALAFTTQSTRVLYWEYYPAAVRMYTNGENILPATLIKLMQSIMPAGVRISITISKDIVYPFSFADRMQLSAFIYEDGKGLELQPSTAALGLQSAANDPPEVGGFFTVVEPQYLLLDTDEDEFLLLDDGDYLQIFDRAVQVPLVIEGEEMGQWSQSILEEEKL